jgi:hypothetical protein
MLFLNMLHQLFVQVGCLVIKSFESLAHSMHISGLFLVNHHLFMEVIQKLAALTIIDALLLFITTMESDQ